LIAGRQEVQRQDRTNASIKVTAATASPSIPSIADRQTSFRVGSRGDLDLEEVLNQSSELRRDRGGVPEDESNLAYRPCYGSNQLMIGTELMLIGGDAQARAIPRGATPHPRLVR
jgi:hypothetical protein